MKNKISILICFFVVVVYPAKTHAQLSKSEIIPQISDLYNNQFNITKLPNSFNDCAYNVYIHNYNRRKPERNLGDECIGKLLEVKMAGVSFSDNGRKFFQTMKPSFINTCINNSNGASTACSCYYNTLDEKGFNITEILNIEDSKPELHETIYNSCFGIKPNNPTASKNYDSLLEDMKKYFRVNYNVVSLPEGLLKCVSENREVSASIEFDRGYLIAKKCIPNYIDQIEFSDSGKKYLATFNDAFVLTCSNANESYSKIIKVTPFCNCLHEEYVKYEVGFKDILDEKFSDTILSQKITEYCIKMNTRS